MLKAPSSNSNDYPKPSIMNRLIMCLIRCNERCKTMASSFQFPVKIQTHTLTSQGVTIYYPQFIGLANQIVQNSINQAIYQQVLLLQQHQMKVQLGTHMKMIGHFEIKTNERGLLSLILSNY